MRSERLSLADVIAGASVAFVLIPQSLAYADLAGMPAAHGLYASALPPIAAALCASSPYLQTGPVAMTSLLGIGAPSHIAMPEGTPSRALCAASPSLQTGPVAMTSLLVFGALSHIAMPETPPYVALAALLALVVGLSRVALGLLRFGRGAALTLDA